MSGGAPAFLPAGRSLAAWLNAAPSRGAPRARLWAYRWKAYFFDANWRRQETLYPVARFEGEGGRKLIFVMGFWRSGTTLLHELLALGAQVAAPRTWQCMNPSAFRIAGAPKTGRSVSRPMDKVLVDALSPQEDEFALLARGAPSIYRAWLDPRRWQESLLALEQDTWLRLPESAWLADWRTFLGWCMTDGATHLVIKSPNHLFRLRALRRVWPQARLVWTLRDPANMWHSNRKMWQAMMAMYGLWPGRSEQLDLLLFKAMTEYADTLRWAADTLDSETVIYLDFARLGADAAGVLERVTQRLQLGPWQSWRAGVERRLSQSAGQRPDSYDGAAALPAYADMVLADIRELHDRLLAQVHLA
jgi:hypothetical protein